MSFPSYYFYRHVHYICAAIGCQREVTKLISCPELWISLDFEGRYLCNITRKIRHIRKIGCGVFLRKKKTVSQFTAPDFPQNAAQAGAKHSFCTDLACQNLFESPLHRMGFNFRFRWFQSGGGTAAGSAESCRSPHSSRSGSIRGSRSHRRGRAADPALLRAR